MRIALVREIISALKRKIHNSLIAALLRAAKGDIDMYIICRIALCVVESFYWTFLRHEF